ncbi:MAG TPA: hypothetical protein VL002_00155 [Candidimonas sp.]|nr:hypothetical protein [Candidimonas sp.]
MKVASLEIELLANIARLQNDMGRATRTVDGAMQRISRATAMAMKAIGGLAAAFSARAIYQQIRNITTLASRYNELGIVMGVVGRNAGYSRPYLDGLEKSLKATGISALESRSNIAKLIAANIDLTKATELARLAQDAAVIGGLNSSDAFARLTSGIQSAQVETLRTMGLNANFKKSYEDLAAQLGKNTKDLTELEKTQARTNAVLALAPTIAGAYEASMTNAGKAMRSTQRYAEDLGVALGQAFQPAFEVAVTAYSNTLKSAMENVDLLKRAMTALSLSVIPLVVAGFTKLAITVIPMLTARMWALTAAMLSNPMTAIPTLISMAIAAFVMFDEKTEATRDAFSKFGQVWQEIFADAKKVTDELKQEVANLWGGIKDLTGDTSPKTWTDALIVGLARVADVAALVVRSIGTVIFAFNAALADVKVGLAWLGRPDVLTKMANPTRAAELEAEYQQALANRKAEVDRFNESLDALVNGPLNKYEQAALRAVNTIRVVSDEVVLVDLTLEKLTETTTENTKATSAAAKAAEAFAKAREDGYTAHRNEISNIHQQARALEDQVKVFGQGERALEHLAIARLEEQAAMLSGFEGSEEQVRLIELEIDARQRLLDAGLSLDRLEEEQAANREMLADWKQTVDEYDRVFRDGFADMLNNGKSGWKSFTKSLVTTFKTSVADQIYKMFAQPFVVNLVANMMGMTGGQQQGGVAGALQKGGGMPNFNMMMGSGAGNAIASAGNFIGSSMVAEFGAGLTAGAGGALTDAGATALMNIGVEGSTSFMAGSSIGGAGLGSIMGYASALYDLTQGNYGSAVGTAIGTAILPGIGTVVGGFLGGMVDGIFGHEPRTRHGKSTVYELTDDNGIYRKHDEMRHEEEYYRSMEQMTQAAIDGINSTFGLLGVDATLGNFWSRTDISTNPNSDKGDGVSSGGAVMVGGKWIDIGIPHSSDDTKFGVGGWSDEPVLPRLALDLQLTMLEAFQAASEELPTILAGMLEGVDIRGMDIEAAQALAVAFDSVIQQVGLLQAAVEILPFESLRDLSFDAAANLIHFAGGLEALDAGMTSYFQNFYTEAEQLEWQTKQISGAFESLGLEMPDVTQGADSAKAAYRALVEAQDVNTEAGAQATAMLMTLSGGFAELVAGMDELDGAVGEVGDAMERINQLASQLSRAFQLVMTGGNLSDRIGGMLGHSATFAAQREQQLWATIGEASYEQQIQMSGELTDLVLGRISKEQEAEKTRLAGIQQQIAGLSRMRDLGASLQNYLRSLESSDLAPYSLREKVGNAESDLARLVAAARRGDDDAMRQVQGSLQNTLKLWREYGASGAEYEAAYHRLTGMVGNLAGAAVSDADRQIAQLEAQAASLEGISGYSAEQLEQLQQLYDITTAATEAAQAQEQMLLDATRTEIDHLESMGLDTARLHDIAELLQGLPASLAAQLSGTMSVDNQYMLANPDVMRNFEQYGASSGLNSSEYALDHYDRFGKNEGRPSREFDYLFNNPDVMSAFNSGQAGGMSAEEFARYHWDTYGKFEDRPSFMSGTPFVQRDMTADIHRGEIIIDPRSSDILRRYGIGVQGKTASDGEVVAELRAINTRLERIEAQDGKIGSAQVAAINNSAERIGKDVGNSLSRKQREDINARGARRQGVLA